MNKPATLNSKNIHKIIKNLFKVLKANQEYTRLHPEEFCTSCMTYHSLSLRITENCDSYFHE